MSIYDRLKSQPLMRMQEGGSPLTREQAAEILNMAKEGLPLFSGDGSFTTPSTDLGGGLGGIPGVQLNYNDILAGLKNQQFGIPTVFTEPVVEEEVVEEEDEVVDEVETTAPVMPDAPVTDPIVEVVSDEVAQEVAPTPTPTPSTPPPSAGIPAAGDMVTQLPRVVLPPTPAEEMNLITGTDAPLTEEEIFNVATPTMTPTTGDDIARLNQQYNDTFLKMLVQDPVNNTGGITVGNPDQGSAGGTNPDGTESGVVGTPGYTPGTLPDNTVQQYMLGQGQYGISNIPQFQQQYSTPADIQFQMGNVFGNQGGNPQNQTNQNFNNPYEQYGNLMFPTFGSGVTSLVPQDTRSSLY